MALAGVRVVDRSVTSVGRRIGALLADQGATVVAPRADGGDPLWDRGKRVVPQASTDHADVVIDDAPGVPPLAGVVHVRVPPFPEDHPWADVLDPGAAEAAAGLHRPPVGAPRLLPVDVAGPIAALLGACGAVAALIAGQPQTVDVAQLDAGLLAQELGALLAHDPPRRWNPVRWAASPFVAVYPASDGFVYLHAGLPHHLEALLRALRDIGCDRSADQLRRGVSAATRRDPIMVGSPLEARRVRATLREMFAAKPASVWEDLLGPRGLCVAAVRTGGAWRDGPATEAEQAVWVEDPREGRVLHPAPLVRLRSTDAPAARRFGQAPRWTPRAPPTSRLGHLPLRGVRVLDLSQVIAGPTAGRTLAQLGADVLHLENPRLNAAWVDAFHVLFQAGKRSAPLDVGTDAGRRALNELIDRWKPDIIVHNLAAGADERLGLIAPGRVVVAVSAWGRRGPRAGWRGWEQTVQAACGAQWDYGDGRPELMPVPVHDVTTGLAGAFGALCAIHGGMDGVVEASLAQTALWLQEHLFRGEERAPVGRRGGLRRADGAWMHADDAWHYQGVVRVRGGTLATALAGRRAMWARAVGPLGEYTAIASPLRMARTPPVESLAPKRGANADDVGGAPLPAPPPPVSRLRWLLRQAVWLPALR